MKICCDIWWLIEKLSLTITFVVRDVDVDPKAENLTNGFIGG